MPHTVNGIGTSVCPARGFVSWGGPNDFDAVECLVVCFLPVIPFKVVHTFNWNGNQYRQVPIRWSGGVVLRAFLRRWLIAGCVIAVLLAFFGAVLVWDKRTLSGEVVALLVSAALVGAFAGSGLWWLVVTDRRTSNIRRLLGRHALGSSDPATWTPTFLEGVKSPSELHGVETFAAAVPKLLTARAYGDAMWAARLSTALEDRTHGEYLTDTILGEPEVQEILGVAPQPPSSWTQAV